jgi:hypothetical protein
MSDNLGHHVAENVPSLTTIEWGSSNPKYIATHKANIHREQQERGTCVHLSKYHVHVSYQMPVRSPVRSSTTRQGNPNMSRSGFMKSLKGVSCQMSVTSFGKGCNGT